MKNNNVLIGICLCVIGGSICKCLDWDNVAYIFSILGGGGIASYLIARFVVKDAVEEAFKNHKGDEFVYGLTKIIDAHKGEKTTNLESLRAEILNLHDNIYKDVTHGIVTTGGIS